MSVTTLLTWGVVGAGEELIDALYDMVVKLKEEGVI